MHKESCSFIVIMLLTASTVIKRIDNWTLLKVYKKWEENEKWAGMEVEGGAPGLR